MGLPTPEYRIENIIAEAAFDPAKWQTVCDELPMDVGGTSAIIIPFQQDTVKISAPHSENIEYGFKRYIDEGWYKQDVRVRGLSAVKAKGYITDKDCIAYDDVPKSAFYQDLLRPERYRWFVGMAFGSQEDSWVMSVQVDVLRDPFSEAEIKKLLSYRHLLNTSVAIARELNFQRLRGTTDILEQQGKAVIALGSGGQILHVSVLAESLIGNTITITKGTVRAINEGDRPAFDRMVSSAAMNSGKVAINIHPVPLSRNDGKPALIAYACRLPEREHGLFLSATTIIVFIDPEKPQNIPAELLMDYFGFTRAESRLAISMLEGHSLEQHAKDSGITIITARNHLQGLLSKTMTHSKAELVAMLYRVAANCGFPYPLCCLRIDAQIVFPLMYMHHA
jgi:DNA-binding CsgD family transcriptional regulator